MTTLTTKTRSALALLAACVLAPAAFAQHDAKAGQPGEDVDAAMMQAWMEAATPGEHHKHLEQLVGEWEGVTKWWMEPNGPASESATTCSSRMVMDGRYLSSHYTGVVMGMPFQGVGTWGYNNTTGKYESTWIDNMGTMTMYMTGACSDDGKTFTMESRFIDPMTKQDTYMKEICTILGPDAYQLQMFGPGPDGNEFMMMEMTYHRVNASAPRSRTPGANIPASR